MLNSFNRIFTKGKIRYKTNFYFLSEIDILTEPWNVRVTYAFCEKDDVDADDSDSVGVGFDTFALEFGNADRLKFLNFLNWFPVDELKWICEQSKSN